MELGWAVRGGEGTRDLGGTKLGTRGSWSSSDKETKKTGKLLFAPGTESELNFIFGASKVGNQFL